MNSKSKFTIKETLNKKERKWRVDSCDEAVIKRAQYDGQNGGLID